MSTSRSWDPGRLHREHAARAAELSATAPAKVLGPKDIPADVLAAIMADAAKGKAKAKTVGPVADPNKVRAVLREAREEREREAAETERRLDDPPMYVREFPPTLDDLDHPNDPWAANREGM